VVSECRTHAGGEYSLRVGVWQQPNSVRCVDARQEGRKLDRLIHALNGSGKFESALRYATRYVEVAPEVDRSWCCLSWTCHRLGDIHTAFTAGRRAVELSPDMEWALRTYVRALLSAGKPGVALEYARSATRLSPQDSGGWLALAQCCLTLCCDDETIAAVERAASLAPERIEVTMATVTMWRKKDPSHAIALCLDRLRSDPDSIQLLLTLAYAYFWGEQYEPAQSLLKSVLGDWPGDSHANRLYAYSIGALGTAEQGAQASRTYLESAVRKYEDKSRQHPDWYAPHRDRALSLRMLGRHSDALEACQAAQELPGGEDDAYLWKRMAFSLASLERWSLALEAIERAVDLDPSSPLYMIDAAEIAFLSTRPDDVDAWTQRIIEGSPQSGLIEKARALRQMACGNYVDGLNHLENYDWSQSPLNSCRMCEQALCSARIGDVVAARQLLERADYAAPLCGCEWRQAANAVVAAD